MAISPNTIRVTNDALADELVKAGQRLIELSMRVRAGFDVPIEYRAEEQDKSSVALRAAGSA